MKRRYFYSLDHEPEVHVNRLLIHLIDIKCLFFSQGDIHGKTPHPHTGCGRWRVHLVLLYFDACFHIDPFWNNDVHVKKWQSNTDCQIHLAYECFHSSAAPPPAYTGRHSFGVNHMPFCLTGRHRKRISMDPFLVLS